MDNWTTANLDDCLDALLDYRGKSPKKSPTGIPVLSAKVVKTDGLLRPIEQTISPDYYSKWMVRGLPAVGDVVMTTEAPLGEVIQLNDESVSFALGQRIVCMRGKEGILDSTFLRYALISPQQQANLAASATGTTVLGISQKALRRIEISFPGIAEQRKIGGLLAKIDDKIELNRRMNDTLEDMARALFRDWFVDFGPTRRQMDGATDSTVIMGHAFPADKAATLAQLFPSKIDDYGLPEGWEKRDLRSALTLNYGKSLPKKARKPGPFNVFGSGGISGTHNTPLARGPSTIVGRKGTVGSLYWTRKDFYAIDTVFYVTSSYPMVYCHRLLETLGLETMNTDAAVPGLNRDNAYRQEFAFGGDNLIYAYAEFVETLTEKCDVNEEENQTLIELRDLLLPKLMSGTVRLKDGGEPSYA